MVIGIQLLSAVLVLGMIYFALISLRKKEITGNEFISWFVIWIFVFLVIMFPDIARTYSKTFLFARLFDLMVVGAIVMLLIMVSRVYVKSKRLEKRLEKYVRKDALKDARKTNENKPLVSIVIPSLNKGKYIESTLKSIFIQDYKNYEVIIQDGGSADSTLDILKQYKKKYPKRLSWVSQKDKGQADAINKGLKKTKGDIVTYINADDIYEQGAFRTVVESYLNNPDAIWFAGRGIVIENNGKEIVKVITKYKNLLLSLNSYKLLLITNYLMQPSVFLTRKTYEKFGPFTSYKSIVIEYDLWLKIGKMKMPFIIEKNLSSFRMTNDNISSTQYSKTLGEDQHVTTKHTSNSIILLLHTIHNLLRKIIVKLL